MIPSGSWLYVVAIHINNKEVLVVEIETVFILAQRAFE